VGPDGLSSSYGNSHPAVNAASYRSTINATAYRTAVSTAYSAGEYPH
jgi:hypothetical protein